MPTKSSIEFRRERVETLYRDWLAKKGWTHSPDNAAHFAASSTEHGTAKLLEFSVGEVSRMLGGNPDWES